MQISLPNTNHAMKHVYSVSFSLTLPLISIWTLFSSNLDDTYRLTPCHNIAVGLSKVIPCSLVI